MLSKFADVTPDGRYIQPPHAKLSYGGVRLSDLQQTIADCLPA